MVFSKIVVAGKQNHGASSPIKAKAIYLRKNMTSSEKILWDKLRRRQLKNMYFRRQHPYGIYILDFYCFEANLVIEVDGEIHSGREDYDNERTRYLESSGLKVLRFENKDVITRLNWVIELISSNLIKNEYRETVI